MPDIGPIEELPSPRCVCDEACLAMRQSLNDSKTCEQQLMNIEELLNLPEEGNDVEIAKARQKKKWTEFLEDVALEA